jgi:acetyl-CoA synthetase
MTPTEAFLRARDVLVRNASDPAKARAEFRWPELTAWNWAYDYFDVIAHSNTRTALRIVRDGAADEVISFTELADRSTRVARYLQNAGIRRGDGVLVILGNVAPLFETLLACIRVGAVMIPSTTQLTASDIEDRVTRGRVHHVVTDAEGAAKLENRDRLHICLSTTPAEGFSNFDDARSESGTPRREETRATDPLLLYFTSGTTAKPKLVLHTHASYPVGHLSTMYWIGIREGEVHQNISSPGWAKHVWSSVFAPWNAGATSLVHDYARFHAERTLAMLRSHEVATLCAPPTVWRMLILETLGAKPARLRAVVSAGEPLNPEVIETVERAWKLTIRDGYGQTETTAQVGNSPGLPVKPGSMGQPLPGYDVVLLDGEGREADEGEVSLKLSPRPLGLMIGYMDDEVRTKEVTAGGYYRTGDEASRDADGYFHFIGRGDDVFKSSDYRLSPFELESVLLEHPAVAEAAVVPSPDAVRLSVPKAFITLKPGTDATAETARSIFEHARTSLAPYKRIHILEFRELPKTISGKIRRVDLRKQEAAQRERGEHGALEFFYEPPKA